jgi:hypothetical protein
MRTPSNQPALLANLAGAHMSPVASQYQFCVDAGAAAAVGFFDDLAVVGLHDHLACSIQGFVADVAAMTPADINAFAAGYLGRVHQELRMFCGEPIGPHWAPEEARMFLHTLGSAALSAAAPEARRSQVPCLRLVAVAGGAA